MTAPLDYGSHPAGSLEENVRLLLAYVYLFTARSHTHTICIRYMAMEIGKSKKKLKIKKAVENGDTESWVLVYSGFHLYPDQLVAPLRDPVNGLLDAGEVSGPGQVDSDCNAYSC